MLTSRGSNSYTNDMNGNCLTGGGHTNTWDSQNRLNQCVYVNGGTTTTSNFLYGADGQRHQMSSLVNGVTTTTNFVLDNSILVRERRNNANYATYLVGPRGPEYRRDDTTGNVSWYIYDGLGSVVAEVKGDGTGTVTSSRKYDVFGSVRGGVNPSGTSKQKFVGGLGHVSDDETGYVYMRARYMDPAIGRFVSQDPAKHGRNWYAYCHVDPISYRDASGKDELGEELEADTDMAELGEEDASAPSQLLYSTRHAVEELTNWFAKYAPRPYDVHDIGDVLDLWNSSMAQMSAEHAGSWVLKTKLYDALLILVASDEGDGIGRLVTAFSPFD